MNSFHQHALFNAYSCLLQNLIKVVGKGNLGSHTKVFKDFS